MKIWEVINFSDAITLLTDDFDYAVAAALSLGEGYYGLQEHPSGREMPIFAWARRTILDNWLRESFPEKGLPANPENEEQVFHEFLYGLDRFRLAEVLRSTQACSGQERAAYQKAMEMIEDGAKKQEYARWWKNEHTTSMKDIAGYSWKLAERLEEIARKEEEQSRKT